MKLLKDILTVQPLKNYRTYICVAIIFISGGLLAIKVIDQATFDLIIAVLGGLGLAAAANHDKKESVQGQ